MTSTYDVIYLTGALVCGLALFYKAIRLYRHGGHARSWALTITLAYSVGAAVLSAPTFAGWFDRFVGIDSFATLLEACMEAGFACGALSLVTYWRYPLGRACDLVWRFSKFFFGLVAVLAALFAISSFPGSHEVDFISQYAHQPTVSAFVLVYLIPTTIVMAASTRGCGVAAKDPAIAKFPWLRRVLRCLQLAIGFAMLHLLGEYVALASVWFDWHSLEWFAPTASAVSTFGFVPSALAAVLPDVERLKPSLGLAIERWQVFVLLRPLHRALRSVNPEAVFVARGKRFCPHHRLRRQLLELSEWRWALAPQFDPDVRSAAQRIGSMRGLSGTDLDSVVEAAQLEAAIHRSRQVSATVCPDVTRCEVTHSEVTHSEVTQDGSGLDSEYTWWVAVAQAFRGSTVVTAALTEAGAHRARGELFTPTGH
nr:MAB_1171c family putative transporter [Kibdelosporangium sp. MJ126-NF4]CEL21868.1 putative integral membrane protein [Kibdelosporangium sp. MJ126-NF4]CTQ92648.1 putative integral membrane protein [Kibdelosporangium sp. MJ126-NF4]